MSEPIELFGDDDDRPSAATPVPAETFAIDSADRANWLLCKLGNMDREIECVSAQAADIVGGLKKEREGLLVRFGAELKEWALRDLAERNARTKTLKLLYGSVSFRSVPAHVALVDKEAGFVHARTVYPDLIEVVTTEKMNWDGYKAAAKTALETSGGDTDALLPGTEYVPAKESMSLKLGSAGKESGS